MRLDNGRERRAQAVIDWGEAHGIARPCIQPGQPPQHACTTWPVDKGTRWQ